METRPQFSAPAATRPGWRGVEIDAPVMRWHGLQRFRLRGLVNVNIQVLLIVAGQNLKRWLRASGWGRSDFPDAAFVPLERPLSASSPS